MFSILAIVSKQHLRTAHWKWSMGANRPSSRSIVDPRDGKQWPICNYSRISREKPRNGKAVIEYDSGLTEPIEQNDKQKTKTRHNFGLQHPLYYRMRICKRMPKCQTPISNETMHIRGIFSDLLHIWLYKTMRNAILSNLTREVLLLVSFESRPTNGIEHLTINHSNPRKIKLRLDNAWDHDGGKDPEKNYMFYRTT